MTGTWTVSSSENFLIGSEALCKAPRHQSDAKYDVNAALSAIHSTIRQTDKLHKACIGRRVTREWGDW